MSRRYTRVAALALMGLTALPPAAFAQAVAPDLRQVSIEDLMNLEITSASRKEQRAADVAAAVFVITADDIRRSGMTTLPDLLRLAPGVNVAQINANKWAVSVRGFNALYANKLLVLVDGRGVYNRIFSGVVWDTTDLMLDDIERIEVIRGPGAAIWGANAVNGVINIVTKSATATQGGLVRADAGGSGAQGAVRYGGALGRGRYRLYSQWGRQNESVLGSGVSARDASHSITSGFRADWTRPSGAFMLDGDFTAGQARALWPNLDPATAAAAPIADVPTDTSGGHVLGRWTKTRSGGGTLQLQSFVDVASRQEPIGSYRRRSFDVDSQYHTALGARQDLVVGAGYRFINERLLGRGGLSMTPAEGNASLLTAFAQDEIQFFAHRLAVTLGSQIQYDSLVGGGVQPSARLIWKGLPRQRVWASASRALRTPALSERSIRVDMPPAPGPNGLPLVVTTLGNPAAQSETLVDIEAGYRLEIGAAASLDVTAFAGRYDRLTTNEVSAPVVEFSPSPRILVTSTIDNQLAAATRGLEIAGHWAPAASWFMDGSYSLFHVTPELAATSLDPTAAASDASAPGRQWQLRSTFMPAPRATVSASLFHVGPLAQMQIDGYTRADVSGEWQFSRSLAATLTVQNIFASAHAEFGGTGSLLLATRVPRSATLRLRWLIR